MITLKPVSECLEFFNSDNTIFLNKQVPTFVGKSFVGHNTAGYIEIYVNTDDASKITLKEETDSISVNELTGGIA